MAPSPPLSFEAKPVIGVIHLPPLPGSPPWRGTAIEDVVARATRDAKALVEGGVDAIIVENYGDAPFRVRVREPLTIASMAVVVASVTSVVDVPVGVSLLRNSGPEALAIAFAAGASFIRVNAYCEVRVAPEGILEPVAAEVEELRSKLPRRVQVLADVDVKHSKPITPSYDARETARECIERGAPDALIVTGPRTGEPTPPGYVAAIKSAVPGAPILIGSGITAENIAAYWSIADGFIIGTYFKEGAATRNPVDPDRVRRLIRVVEKLRRKH